MSATKSGSALVGLLIILFFITATSSLLVKILVYQHDILHKTYLQQKIILISESCLYAAIQTITPSKRVDHVQDNIQKWNMHVAADRDFDCIVKMTQKDNTITEALLQAIVESVPVCTINCTFSCDDTGKKTILSWNSL